MVKRTLVQNRPWLLASIAAAVAYFVLSDARIPGIGIIALKGAGVACLSVYAWLRHSSADARLLAVVMALSALGDIGMEFYTAIGGGIFLVSHLFAMALYLRNRRQNMVASQKLFAVALAFLTPFVAWQLVSSTADAAAVTVYALALGAMAGLAWTSSFPRYRVGLGAVLFVISDLLIFAQMDILAQSPIPAWLIWPTYYAGQFLIATGVIQTLRNELQPE
ncbi:lysoplasmalogenase [Altererythrobacter confluentis]|uniref:Lysoplasmalogenase n=1 Tax=Allopontixanthobacter confluentis TaxID=1849021 RepID=A0A6L7GET4_9SPHN|nr:lysoplasmalogenase [Allopontixanthobacter confluentis]MXP14130.1 lysoplasmalogenase [Allopontixanthobacter confluentis]